MEGQVADIVSNSNAAEAVSASLESRRMLLCSWLAAELKLYLGEAEDARAAFLEGLRTSRGLCDDLVSYFFAALANPAQEMHNAIDTFRWAVSCLAWVQKKDPMSTLHALQCLADLYMIFGDEDTALNLFNAALAGGTAMDIYRLRAECMVGIGEILLRRGDPI
jgi:tetratricopeptide (TPR) repeat protein